MAKELVHSPKVIITNSIFIRSLANLDSWRNRNLSIHPSRLQQPWRHYVELSWTRRLEMCMEIYLETRDRHESMELSLVFRRTARPVLNKILISARGKILK